MKVWEFLLQMALHLPRNQECGTSVDNNRFAVHSAEGRVSSEIIGGIPLRTASSSPWMVAVGERVRNGSVDWYCAGALVRPNKVLTAAHCVVRRKPHVVRVGELDFDSIQDPSAPEDVPVSYMSLYPEYKPPVNYHDVAVLHLQFNVRVNKYVTPVCLPSAFDKIQPGQRAMLTGWGHQYFGGDRSSVLREVSVTVINNTACSALYSRTSALRRSYPRGIIDSQLCAGDEQGGKDACQGDSGGPLVVKQPGTRVHFLVGIVSSGVGCGSTAFPGVYTRVTAYLHWINAQLLT